MLIDFVFIIETERQVDELGNSSGSAHDQIKLFVSLILEFSAPYSETLFKR